MPFLSPNQQCQSTEGNVTKYYHIIYEFTNCIHTTNMVVTVQFKI